MKDGQTIGQWLKWDFKTNGDLEIKDKNGRRIYYERSDKSWGRYEHNSKGFETYYCDSRGYWERRERDSQGNRIYYEDSSGEIIDNRVQTITYEGRKYQLIP